MLEYIIQASGREFSPAILLCLVLQCQHTRQTAPSGTALWVQPFTLQEGTHIDAVSWSRSLWLRWSSVPACNSLLLFYFNVCDGSSAFLQAFLLTLTCYSCCPLWGDKLTQDILRGLDERAKAALVLCVLVAEGIWRGQERARALKELRCVVCGCNFPPGLWFGPEAGVSEISPALCASII